MTAVNPSTESQTQEENAAHNPQPILMVVRGGTRALLSTYEFIMLINNTLDAATPLSV